MRPYQIRDPNGNVSTISYINSNDLSIGSITDSLGRSLNFFYTFVQVQMVPGQVFQTVPLLNCVTDGASCNAAGARTYSLIWDQSHAINFNFSLPGQMLMGGTLYGVQSGFAAPVLTKVCRPDATCVKFNYGDWGIVNDIQELSKDGTVRYELSYDFPAVSGPLDSNPTYTHQKETVNGQTSTWTFGRTMNAGGLMTSSSITDPNGLVTTTTFAQNGSVLDGLPTQVQMIGSPVTGHCPPSPSSSLPDGCCL